MKTIEKNIEIKTIEAIEKPKKEIRRYKDFQVDYIRLFEEEINSDGEIISNNPLDIEPTILKLKSDKTKKRIKEYRGDIIRLQNIEKLDNLSDNLEGCKNIWSLHFIRIRVNQLSGVASSDGEYSETLLNEKLNNNQHLAESTACLYDADKQLLVISRHRDGVMPSAIIDFFRMVTKNKNITYGIIPYDVNVKSKSSSIYRRLLVGIKDVDKLDSRSNKILKKIPSVWGAINSFKGYGYCNIKIELSMGDSPKNRSMNNQAIKDTSLKLMESDLDNINKLEVSSKESIDTSVETIDLLNNKIKDKFSIGFTRSDSIVFKKLEYSLLNSYNKKKGILDMKI